MKLETDARIGMAQEVRLHDGAVVRRRRARHLHQLAHQIPRGPARPRLPVITPLLKRT